MKQYSTNAYYNYARRLLEDDSSASKPESTIVDKSNDAQFTKTIAAASTGAVGAMACMKYLSNTFQVQTVGGWATTLETGIKTSIEESGGNVGIFTSLKNLLISGVSKTLRWVATLANWVQNKIPQLRSTVLKGRPYTYGQFLALALVGAAIGTVIYKAYKIIKNKTSNNKTESYQITNKKIKLEAKQALIELDMMFKELDMFAEAGSLPSGSEVQNAVGLAGEFKIGKIDTLNGGTKEYKYFDNKGNVASVLVDKNGKVMSKQAAMNVTNGRDVSKTVLSKNSDGSYSEKMYDKNGNLVNMKNDQSKITQAEAAKLSKAEGFVDGIKARLQEMWTSVSQWCSSNPILATVIGICVALIACWYGVKKWKDHQAKKQASKQTAAATV